MGTTPGNGCCVCIGPVKLDFREPLGQPQQCPGATATEVQHGPAGGQRAPLAQQLYEVPGGLFAHAQKIFPRGGPIDSKTKEGWRQLGPFGSVSRERLNNGSEPAPDGDKSTVGTMVNCSCRYPNRVLRRICRTGSTPGTSRLLRLGAIMQNKQPAIVVGSRLGNS